MMIVDDASGDSNRAHLAVDVIVYFCKLLLERRGESDDFERRTGFVNILQRPIGSCFRLSFGYLIRIKRRGIGESQNFAAAWIEDDHRSRLCSCTLNCGLKRL